MIERRAFYESLQFQASGLNEPLSKRIEEIAVKNLFEVNSQVDASLTHKLFDQSIRFSKILWIVCEFSDDCIEYPEQVIYSLALESFMVEAQRHFTDKPFEFALESRLFKKIIEMLRREKIEISEDLDIEEFYTALDYLGMERLMKELDKVVIKMLVSLSDCPIPPVKIAALYSMRIPLQDYILIYFISCVYTGMYFQEFECDSDLIRSFQNVRELPLDKLPEPFKSLFTYEEFNDKFEFCKKYPESFLRVLWKDFDAALLLSPSNLMAKTLKAYQLKEQNSIDDAEVIIQDVLAINPRFDLAKIFMAYLSLGRGKVDAAWEHSRLCAPSFHVYAIRGRIFYERRMYERALDYLKKSFDFKPNPYAAAFTALIILKKNREDAVKFLEIYGVRGTKEEQALLLYAKAAAYPYDRESIKKSLDLFPTSGCYLLAAANPPQETKRTYIQKSLELNPYNAEAYALIGMIALEKFKYDQALIGFDTSLEINPDQSKILHARSKIYYEQGNLNGALSDLNRAIELEPENPVFFAYRALINLDSGFLISGASDIGSAVRIDSNQAIVQAVMGEYYRKYEDLDTAIDCFEKALNMDPYCGIALSRLGKIKSSKDMLIRALSINPNNVFANIHLVKLDLLGDLKNLDRLVNVLILNPSHKEALSLRAFFLVLQDTAALEIVSDLDFLLQHEPDNDQIYALKGCCYLKTDLSEAEKQVNLSLSKKANNPLALSVRGEIFGKKKEYQKSLNDFKAAFPDKSPYPRFNFVKGYCLAALNKFKAAEKVWEDLHPPLYRNWLKAYILYKKKKYQKALIYLSQVNAYKPEITLLKANIQYKNKKYEEAAVLYAQLANSHYSEEVYYRLACTLYVQNKYSDALYYLNRVIRHDPTHIKAKKLYARILK